MSFRNIIEQFRGFDFEGFFSSVSSADVERALSSVRPGPLDLLTLLSEKAATHLEAMATKAHSLTVQFFGRTAQLFMPLYISNTCVNECVYCGFNRIHGIERRRLGLSEIEQEARAIAATGIRHLLVLTGEARQVTPPDYLMSAVALLRKHFSSVAIEMFPMDQPDYENLVRSGADGLTIYQEVYDPDIYRQMHPAGPKTDYAYRMEAPHRGGRAGFRAINIGPLLGLGEPLREVFFCGLHARWLQDRFSAAEIGLSLPRINPSEGGFIPPHPVDDRTFVQFLTALRIFMPRAGISISTRERAAFRDRLLKLGATRFSAGSCTGVGGYSDNGRGSAVQFEISDHRSVPEFVQAVVANGYQPVYKDWDAFA